MKNFVLEVLNGEFKGRRFPVKPGGIKLGRSSANDVAIPDIELSRSHCIFEMYGEGVLKVTDLASANGTRVNGNDIGSKSVELKPDDVVEVGDTRIRIAQEKPEAPAEAKDRAKDRSKDKPLVIIPDKDKPEEEKPKATAKERMRQILWGATVGMLVLAFAVVLLSTEEMGTESPRKQRYSTGTRSLSAEEDAPEPADRISFSYERVVADSKGIFRLYVTLEDEDSMRVVLDEVGDSPRHINEPKTIKAKSLAVLREIFDEADLDKLDSEYRGPDSEPPVLNSVELEYSIGAGKKPTRILIVNFPEPKGFKLFAKKLETFVNTEMDLTALAYNADQLLEMARSAAAAGATKYEDRDVSEGNLYASVKAYEEAIMYLKTINPKPKEYGEYLERLEASRSELDARHQELVFEATHAKKNRDWEGAKAKYRQIMELVSDRSDERYQQAGIELGEVEKRLKKGGR